MRLIDADKLILHLNDYALQEAPFIGEDGNIDVYEAIVQCMEAVTEQPTAYDVDKVVKELEEWSFDADIIVPTIPPSYSTIIHKNVIAKGNAIVIVKENINHE